MLQGMNDTQNQICKMSLKRTVQSLSIWAAGRGWRVSWIQDAFFTVDIKSHKHTHTYIHTYRVLQRSNITPREQGATPDRTESREKNRLKERVRERHSERESEEQRRVETLSHLPAFNTHYTRATGSCSWNKLCLCVFVWYVCVITTVIIKAINKNTQKKLQIYTCVHCHSKVWVSCFFWQQQF